MSATTDNPIADAGDRSEARRSYVEAQIALVDTLVPGSVEHRVATRVLLLLQDGVHLLEETKELKRGTQLYHALGGGGRA